MDLTKVQKDAIAGWVAEGLKLSDIQTRIEETFEITLTYMDVRFLIDDLELELKDQPKPVGADLLNAPPLEESKGNELLDENNGAGLMGGGDLENRPSVSVVLDKLYKPGAVVSGKVTFSDGERADWTLDQIGRLALAPATEGYQPDESDIQSFQKELSMLLQGHGF